MPGLDGRQPERQRCRRQRCTAIREIKRNCGRFGGQRAEPVDGRPAGKVGPVGQVAAYLVRRAAVGDVGKRSSDERIVLDREDGTKRNKDLLHGRLLSEFARLR